MSDMEDKHNIAYTIIHNKCDYTVGDENIDNTKEIIKPKCPKCGAEIEENDNFCKECGNSTKNSYTAKEIEDLHSVTRYFIGFIVVLTLACFVFLSPIEFDINLLGLTIHPKLKYSILDQAINIEIGAMSFKRENVSITDFISLKYKYLTNKKDFDDMFRSINNSIGY